MEQYNLLHYSFEAKDNTQHILKNCLTIRYHTYKFAYILG